MKSPLVNKILLFPYFLALKIRHWLYDKGLFKSYSFDIPIISVGNLSVGGTGKTPHVELIVKELVKTRRVAVISRGYGRKTRGYRVVKVTDSTKECGDEPLQIKRRYPGVMVAVDGNRVRAIKNLLAMNPDEKPEVIVMDDGFQHRRVIPSVNILLIDYNRPLDRDNLLPLGRLRDLPEQIKRAGHIVVTKCPQEISDDEKFKWEKRLKTANHQKLYFSTIEYGEPLPVFMEGDKRYTYSRMAIMVTGIANPKPLEYYLSDNYKIIRRLSYKDHHRYRNRDVRRIERVSRKFPKAVVYTTEKDAQRLYNLKKFSDQLRTRFFFLPIEIRFLNGSFLKLIESVNGNSDRTP